MIYCAFSCVLSAKVMIVLDARTPGTVLGIMSELITNNIKGVLSLIKHRAVNTHGGVGV
jgi:hypothetical protein